MALAKLGTFIRELSQAMAAEALNQHSDQQLIDQFLAAPSDAVFAALVYRHGPMVFRVCWRVLQHSQDAEDAFQATFLILAQRLRTVRKQASLASWLHGVAYRIALKAKAQAASRRRHEAKAVPARTDLPNSLTWGEIRSLLDAELAQLPEKWRLPLVLCYLESQTQDEAARQLGWSKNTLRRRLEEARDALGRRLSRRGIIVPAAYSALLLSDCIAPVAPTPGLVASTVEAVAGLMTGKTLARAATANVAALTEGVLQAMLMTQLKTVMAVLLVIGFGGGLCLHLAGAQPGPAEKSPVLGIGGPTGQKPSNPAQQDVAKQDLTGEWLMHLPAGFTHQVHLTAAGPERYRLAPDRLNSSGVYELQGDRLVIVDPNDRRLLGFEWQADRAGFVLVGQPAVEKTGANYLGATLRRAPRQASKESGTIRNARETDNKKDARQSTADIEKKALAALQGDWQLQWFEQEGEKWTYKLGADGWALQRFENEGAKGSPKRTYTIRGNKLYEGNDEKALLKVDPTCTPKLLDITFTDPADLTKGRAAEGIYKIEGDSMLWCYSMDFEGVKQRPGVFRAAKGSKFLVSSFTRLEP
jgi:RNA polymerase sigma factor (sigma-70 family)